MKQLGLIDDKEKFLATIRRLVKDDGQVILTTPHPRINWLHQFGAKLGIFGNDGYQSREQLVERHGMAALAARAGLSLKETHFFMFGLNQLFILAPAGPQT